MQQYNLCFDKDRITEDLTQHYTGLKEAPRAAGTCIPAINIPIFAAHAAGCIMSYC